MNGKKDPRIKLLDRLKLQLSGHVYVGHRQHADWKEPLPHYAFNCPIHGIVEDYPHGFDQRLQCPLCRQEIHQEKKIIINERDKK
jgi:hypothetical protein